MLGIQVKHASANASVVQHLHRVSDGIGIGIGMSTPQSTPSSADSDSISLPNIHPSSSANANANANSNNRLSSPPSRSRTASAQPILVAANSARSHSHSHSHSHSRPPSDPGSARNNYSGDSVSRALALGSMAAMSMSHLAEMPNDPQTSFQENEEESDEFETQTHRQTQTQPFAIHPPPNSTKTPKTPTQRIATVSRREDDSAARPDTVANAQAVQGGSAAAPTEVKMTGGSGTSAAANANANGSTLWPPNLPGSSNRPSLAANGFLLNNISVNVNTTPNDSPSASGPNSAQQLNQRAAAAAAAASLSTSNVTSTSANTNVPTASLASAGGVLNSPTAQSVFSLPSPHVSLIGYRSVSNGSFIRGVSSPSHSAIASPSSASSASALSVRIAQMGVPLPTPSALVTQTPLPMVGQYYASAFASMSENVHKSSSLSSAETASLMQNQHSLLQETLAALHRAENRVTEMTALYHAAAFAERKGRGVLHMHTVMKANKSKGIEALTDGMIHVIRSILNCDKAAIYFVLGSTVFGLEPADARNYDEFKCRRFCVGEFVAGHVALKNVSMVVNNPAEEPLFDRLLDVKTGYRTRNIIAAPVRDPTDCSVIAVVQAVNKQKMKQPPKRPTTLSSPISGNGQSNNASSAATNNHYASASAPSSAVSPSIPIPQDTPKESDLCTIISEMTNLNEYPRPQFSPEDADILEALCEQIAVPIRRSLTDIQIDQLDRYSAPTASAFANAAAAATVVVSPSTASGSPTHAASSQGYHAASASSSSLPHSLSLTAAAAGSGGTLNADQINQVRSLVGTYSSSDAYGMGAVSNNQRIARGARARTLSYQFPAQLLQPNPSGVHMGRQPFKLEDLHQLSFNVFDYSDNDLLRCTVAIFQEMGFLTEFRIQNATLFHFLVAVRKKYRANPFHCWQHAFSVLQFSYYLLRRTNAADALQSIDVFALMVASLCHDIDHPGNNNAFEINSSSDLALQYNDVHVLEMHHAHQLFRILRNERYNIFSELPPETQRQARAIMVKAILSTDMSKHFHDLKKLEDVMTNFTSGQTNTTASPSTSSATSLSAGSSGLASPDVLSPINASSSLPTISAAKAVSGDSSADGVALGSAMPFDKDSAQDRQHLVNVLIHSSDLSGQCYPTHIAKEWEARISKEFALQAARETELGLEVAPFMQNLHDLRTRARLQTNFIDFVLLPWWKTMYRLFPSLERCWKHLTTNRSYYDNLSAASDDEIQKVQMQERQQQNAPPPHPTNTSRPPTLPFNPNHTEEITNGRSRGSINTL